MKHWFVLMTTAAVFTAQVAPLRTQANHQHFLLLRLGKVSQTVSHQK